ncbi:heavy metal-binding domain-containing protein [Draconibacterium orientale]|uniref:heavy metal-binding domain-containing protein n=1 Tax=Draconibacterium orientale TaxID=1168034 RepID=UPI002A0A2112|nr:heavy metal-binding domain-containing protein [Draconibacterium orientale]
MNFKDSRIWIVLELCNLEKVLNGGKSLSYETTLESINEGVIYKMEKESLAIGANSMLGLKIDNTEYSTQGKSC